MLTRTDLPVELLTDGFRLPGAYARVFELGLTNIQPWQFLDSADCAAVYAELRAQYPALRLLPFARRTDDDDVACFIIPEQHDQPEAVAIVHLFTAPELALDAQFDSFWDWYRAAVDTMIATS